MVEAVKPDPITSRSPLIEFDPARASTPAPLYVGVDDRLYLRASSNLANTVYNVAGNFLHADGVIRPFFHQATPVADRTFQLFVFQLTEGFLLNVGLHVQGTVPIRGQCWAEVGILRGRAVTGAIVRSLFSDYISGSHALGWPPGRISLPYEGPGFSEHRSLGDPAAGAEFSFGGLTNTRGRYRAIFFTLVTDATVANRTPVLILNIGGNPVWRTRRFAAQTASQTRTYLYALGMEYQNAVDVETFHGPLPAIDPHTTVGITTLTDGLQAGDNFGPGLALMEYWLED
jgi:hypothetical protein